MTLFFYGPNMYALRQQLAQMADAYRAKAGSDYGLEQIDGAGVKLQELTAQLQATPFLASSRLVIVEGVAGNKALSDRLPQIMKGVPATTVAVFVERDVDARTVAFKVLAKAEKVMKFESLNGARLLAWASSEVKRLGGEADGGALRELIDRAGEDQWRLDGELNKLVNYNRVVSKESVAEMVSDSIDRSIFDLVEAMAAGRTGDALTAYRALGAGRDSEMYVLTMVQWQLRNLLLAKAAPDGMGADALAKAAGMSPYVAGKMLAARQRRSEASLRAAFEAACDCEFYIKTGRVKAAEGVERLIFRVAKQAG